MVFSGGEQACDLSRDRVDFRALHRSAAQKRGGSDVPCMDRCGITGPAACAPARFCKNLWLGRLCAPGNARVVAALTSINKGQCRQAQHENVTHRQGGADQVAKSPNRLLIAEKVASRRLPTCAARRVRATSLQFAMRHMWKTF
ncbi:hypothetical protein [Dokdonella immobilis]|uniref:hypothetical protein n=1 Tax=Dokdonella immobilis TaxID=578942 RepID=UPI0015877489|nr:hypothetical protein [Dokdonella immobilis]